MQLLDMGPDVFDATVDTNILLFQKIVSDVTCCLLEVYPSEQTLTDKPVTLSDIWLIMVQRWRCPQKVNRGRYSRLLNLTWNAKIEDR